jgi:hypothetical protein
MNIQALLLAIILWGASLFGMFLYGNNNGKSIEQAKQAAVYAAIEDTRKIAMLGAADAISKIVVRNTTVQGKVETIVRDNPIYRDCKHDADSLSVINQALTGDRTRPVSNSSVSGTDPTK